MKHIQPKTLLVVKAVLTAGRFSQRGIRELCGRAVSIGQVNKVTADLQRNGFVERSKGPKRTTYALVDPLGLLRYVALFRSMNEVRAFSIGVDAKEEKIFAELAKRGVVFCLGTAMEHYAAYYRPDQVAFYADDWEQIEKFLATAARGQTKISCYGKIESDTLSVISGSGARFTSKVQTVIDMFCDGKGAYTKPLLRELWGIEI